MEKFKDHRSISGSMIDLRNKPQKAYQLTVTIGNSELLYKNKYWRGTKISELTNFH